MLEILESGLLTTVQDLGRRAYQRFGVPVGGAMDPFALRAANGLVGNPWDAAGLEVTVIGPRLRPTQSCILAVTGADLGLRVGGREAPLWTTIAVRPGTVVEFAGHRNGCRAYVAVAGGVAVPPVMGSRSTYLPAGIGGLQGRALRRGDVLPLGVWSRETAPALGKRVPQGVLPRYGQSVTVRVVLGPQDDHFFPQGLVTFLSTPYRIGTASNRIGYRLVGAAIKHRGPADIVSDGIPLGAVQVPSGGQPILMMADRPTIGGYAKVATVVTADIPLLAQLFPGVSQVRFRATTVAESQASHRKQIAELTRALEGQEVDYERGR